MKEPSPVGRPKQSVVWNYFVYDPDTNQSVCQVEVTRDDGDQGGPSREICGTAVVGNYPSNLKQHLRKNHHALYEEALAKEQEIEQKKKEGATKPMRAKQLTLAESFREKSSYDKQSER